MDLKKFINLLYFSSISDIVFTDHAKIRLNMRALSENDIRDLLRNKSSLIRGVVQQKDERFNVTYKHPAKKDKDIVVVVEVQEKKSKMKLIVVTAFPQDSERRTKVKENE